MKIALLTEKYTPDIGGLAISSARFSGQLASVGHDIRVFAPTLGLPSSEKRSHLSSGVNVTRFGSHRRIDDTLVDWFELVVEEHKHEPFDVLHAYFLTQAGFVATYTGKYLNIPSVVSIRGNDIERAAFDPSRFSQVMYALQNASAVTTNAKELAKKANAFVDREIFIIPNGIDVEHFKPMERNEQLAEVLGIQRNNKEGRAVIGFIGELREKKGMKTLLLAYAQTAKEHSASLLIVGEVRQGEDQTIFEEFKQANPELNIVVTGYIPQNDLPAYYSLIDIFVHPSLRDGLPNAILEAMACEKPIIATSVGGVSELILDGTNGMIIPANDSNTLAETMMFILNNKELMATLGKSARNSIIDKFTPQKELEGNIKVYRTIGAAS